MGQMEAMTTLSYNLFCSIKGHLITKGHCILVLITAVFSGVIFPILLQQSPILRGYLSYTLKGQKDF